MPLVLCLLRAYVYFMKCIRTGITLDVLYAPTSNGGSGITGPQQTNGNSLIILYLMFLSLLNNSHYCDFM